MATFLRAVVVLAALIGIGIFALRFVPAERLRGPTEAALSAAIGRPVQIEGSIRIAGGLAPLIEVAGVTVEELPGRASFGAIGLQLDLGSLLGGKLLVDSVVLREGTVVVGALEPSGDASPASVNSERFTLQLHVSRLEARDVSIVHTNAAGLVTTTAIEALIVDVADRESDITVAANGELDGVDFDISGTLGSLDELSDPDGAWPVALSGTVEAMAFDAQGEVADPRSFSDLDLQLSLEAPDLTTVAFLSDRELPEIGPVRIRARLVDRDGTLGVEKGEIQIGDKGDPLQAKVRGQLDHLDSLDEIQFRLDLIARNLALVGEVFDVELPDTPPLAISGRFVGSDERFASAGFTTRLGESKFTGVLSSSFVPGTRPTLRARFESQLVRLADLGVGAVEEDPSGDEGWTLDAPLPFDRVPELDAQVSIRVNRVTGRGDAQIDELRAELALDEHRIAIEKVDVVFEGGAVRASLRVGRGGSPTQAFSLRATGVRTDHVLAQFDEELALSGLVDAAVELTSEGTTLRSIEADLAGSASLLVRDGIVRTSLSRSMEWDLLAAAFGNRDVGEFEPLECLIGDFRIDAGVAETTTLWFETEHTSVRGVGRLDLGSRLYDLVLVPTPKKRSMLGIAAQVAITGPFDAPEITADRTSIARSAARGVVEGLSRQLLGSGLVPIDPVVDLFWKREGGAKGPCAGFKLAGS